MRRRSMTVESDNEFKDICCEEREKEMNMEDSI